MKQLLLLTGVSSFIARASFEQNKRALNPSSSRMSVAVVLERQSVWHRSCSWDACNLVPAPETISLY